MCHSRSAKLGKSLEFETVELEVEREEILRLLPHTD